VQGLKTQVQVAVAKQTEYYHKVMQLNGSLKEEIQRRHKAELEMKEQEESYAACKSRLAEALKLLNVASAAQPPTLTGDKTPRTALEPGKKRLHSVRDAASEPKASKKQPRRPTQKDSELIELMMMKNRDLDSELQDLQSKVAVISRQVPSHQLKLEVVQAWTRLLKMYSLSDSQVTSMLSSHDSAGFCGGVLRAFELLGHAHETESEISYSNPLLPKRPASFEADSATGADEMWRLRRAEECRRPPVSALEGSLHNEGPMWTHRDQSIQTNFIASSYASSSPASKYQAFTFETPLKPTPAARSSKEPGFTSAKKPDMEAAESLIEAISSQNSRLSDLSRQLNYTSSIRTPKSQPKEDSFPESRLARTSTSSYTKRIASRGFEDSEPTTPAFKTLKSKKFTGACKTRSQRTTEQWGAL
jgi:hypothetical protein